MYPHLLDGVKKIQPEWQRSVVKNTLLVVALLLEQKTEILWKMKGSIEMTCEGGRGKMGF